MAASLNIPFDHMSIVGRDRERSGLGALLDQAARGTGSLVLVGGGAGIGKTTLVRDLARRAGERGSLVVTGSCYDLIVTPPYGPWTQIARSAPHINRLPQPPAALLDDDALAQSPSQDALVSELMTFLADVAAQQPLVIILEDLHWSDHESLIFLRRFSHGLAQKPILIVITYRDDELTRDHELYGLLPALVREAGAHRITLKPLPDSAVRSLLASRYRLSPADEARLADYLRDRAAGNPFFLGELLRALEEEERLQQNSDAVWTIDRLDHLPVPPLVRQVIDGRLQRLGGETRAALDVAAVIGQTVPFALWSTVARMADDDLAVALGDAIRAHVLDDARDGAHVRFTHALVREALYDGIQLPRRWQLHRDVAEALIANPGATPETVATHLQGAGDPRAVEWFTRAGIRAERVAWLTAAEHYQRALQLMRELETDLAERGWLIIRLVRLLRFSDTARCYALLDEAETYAHATNDAALGAYVEFCRTEVSSYTGTEWWTRAADEHAATVRVLRQLSPDDRQRLDTLIERGIVVSDRVLLATFASALSQHGRLTESIDLAHEVIDRGADFPAEAPWALAVATALNGDANEARRWYRAARDGFAVDGDFAMAGSTALSELMLAILPCQTDNRPERLQVAREGERLWTRARGAQGNAPQLVHLPILALEGRWTDAWSLLLEARSKQMVALRRSLFLITLGNVAYAQGKMRLAWELIGETGVQDSQGNPLSISHFSSAFAHLLAAMLLINANDLSGARRWLRTHDDWHERTGAILGRADNHLVWAIWHRAAGDLEEARTCATRALSAATNPRQPLALLRTHRLLGQLDTAADQWDTAEEHLVESVRLAEACLAPYERALTVMARAELHLRAGMVGEARHLARDARSTFERLSTAPALQQIDSLIEMLEYPSINRNRYPAGLTTREVEALRLVAKGLTNAEVAEQLFVSRRTVDQHLRSIYGKLGVSSRAAATRFAVERGLT